jgi:hypothetical protein
VVLAAGALGACGNKAVVITGGTDSTTTSTPAPAAAPSAPQTFHGNGGQHLPTITVATDSTLKWSSRPDPTGGVFQILSDPNGDGNMLFVNTQGQSSGQTAVSAGTYTNVLVNTTDNGWTVTITPGG